MTQPAAEPAKRRWSPRLQFSLRVLLLAITAFAIGFPIWFRWPYRTEEFNYYQTNGKPDPSRIHSRQLITWQRQWGGGKLRQGPTNTWRTDFNVWAVERYEHGVKAGPYEFHSDLCDIAGQFLHGEKHGVWRTTQAGRLLRLETYERGVLHGRIFEVSEQGRTYEYCVDHGRLDWKDRKSLEQPLFQKAAAGSIDNPRILSALRSPAANESGPVLHLDDTLENPVADLVLIHRIPIVIDRRIGLPTKPQMASYRNPDVAAFLLQSAQLHGAVLDYRYGCIWITTPEDAQNWRDPTGVAEIQPLEGSRLSDAWNQQLENHAPACDLSTMLQVLSKHVGGEIDASRIADSGIRESPVDLRLPSLPLHRVLAIVLYQSNCRCKLEQGKLVILPPEPACSP